MNVGTWEGPDRPADRGLETEGLRLRASAFRRIAPILLPLAMRRARRDRSGPSLIVLRSLFLATVAELIVFGVILWLVRPRSTTHQPWFVYLLAADFCLAPRRLDRGGWTRRLGPGQCVCPRQDRWRDLDQPVRHRGRGGERLSVPPRWSRPRADRRRRGHRIARGSVPAGAAGGARAVEVARLRCGPRRLGPPRPRVHPAERCLEH